MRPEDCYVIEDSVAGLTAAQRAGMTPVCFMGSEMYRNNPAQRQAVEALGITHIFYDMAEVKEFLKRKRRYGQRARGKRAWEKSDCQKNRQMPFPERETAFVIRTAGRDLRQNGYSS